MSELDARLSRERPRGLIMRCDAPGRVCPIIGLRPEEIPTRGPSRERLLTDAEHRVLCCLKEGCTDGEIARRLNLSARTVSNHVKRILDKLAARNRTQAVVQALRAGIIHLA